LDESAFENNIEYNSIPEWDSIGHMSLIAELEEIFGISMDIDDIIEFSSYNKGIEILNKYEVSI
jgi:acyl carrier protein